MPLALDPLFIRLACAAVGFHFRYFCHGHIPPGFTVGNTGVAIHFDHGDRRSQIHARRDERLSYLIKSPNARCAGSETLRGHDQINVYRISFGSSVLPKQVLRVETACEKRTLDSVAFDILILHKFDGRLRRRNSTCGRQKQFPRRRLIPSIIGIRNARKKIPERLVPLRRQALEVQLQRELDFARIARSAGIGT